MIIKRHLLLFILVFFEMTLFANAHGNLSERIIQKTSAIKLNPKNAELYFDRGFLYQQHEEYDKSITDYLKAEALGYSDKLLNYRKAETYYKWNKYKLALTASTTCLEKDKSDVKINKLHAQILFELKQFEKAIEYYSFFIDRVDDPRPEDFIELSSYIITTYKDYDKAIEVLNNGLIKLGVNTISLQLQKLDYYEKSNQVENALEQYNHFIVTNKRKEFWYYKKANYLYENKQIVQSKIALEQSKMAISILTDRIKNTQAIKTLKKNINNLEKQLNHE